jgi:hypothetical protein
MLVLEVPEAVRILPDGTLDFSAAAAPADILTALNAGDMEIVGFRLPPIGPTPNVITHALDAAFAAYQIEVLREQRGDLYAAFNQLGRVPAQRTRSEYERMLDGVLAVATSEQSMTVFWGTFLGLIRGDAIGSTVQDCRCD